MPAPANSAISCPRCRFDLRAASDNRCPECGCSFHIRALPLSAGQSPLWWCGMIGGGAALLLVTRMLWVMSDKVVDVIVDPSIYLLVQRGFTPPPDALPNWSAIFILAALLLAVVLGVSVLATRRASLISPGWMDRLLALTMFGAPAVVLVIAFAIARWG